MPLDAGDLYAVTTVDLSGVSKVVLATSRNQAISHFIQLAYLFAHAAPEERFRIAGDDEDASLSGLHLIWDTDGNAIEIVSLTKPGCVSLQEGWISPDYSPQSFVSVAQSLDSAMQSTAGVLSSVEVSRLKNSRAVATLSRPLAGEILSDWITRNPPEEVSSSATQQAWEAMSSVKQLISLTARVAHKHEHAKIS